jgi:hypothetical protein
VGTGGAEVRKPGLYLNDERYDVVRVQVFPGDASHDVCVRGELALDDRRLRQIGGDLNKFAPFVPPAQAKPIRIRYRGMSGLFWLDVSIDISRRGLIKMTFDAVAAGPVTVKRSKK